METASRRNLAAGNERAERTAHDQHAAARRFSRPTEQVEAGVPGFLHPMPKQGDAPGRVAFAKWLVDRNSPTTARAIVNRLWQGHFGTGIVETSEDLGRQSADPSHPKLLDWLAVELMESGWSLKHIHRLIASSETYRQASRVSPELLERDPSNRLLARGSRFRVDGELVRDIALATSGLLTAEVGGAPVYPPARNSCSFRRSATGRSAGTSTMARNGTGAGYTLSATVQYRSPCFQRLTRPRATSPV